MLTNKNRFGFLSNNMLKIIAAIFMVCDHMGVMLFPGIFILRIIGRLSFPIFAYLIAEGAKHTRSKLRHFLTMFSFAAVIQIVYFIYDRSLEMSVLVTFTLSLVIIYALDALKTAVFAKDHKWYSITLTAILFAGSIALALFLDKTVDLDYGFSGCLLPVFPSLLNVPRTERSTEVFERLDRKLPRVLLTAVGILALSFDYGGTQFFSLLTIPLLLLYSEERGRWNMKYFFYVFYPLHLVLLQGIAMLIK